MMLLLVVHSLCSLGVEMRHTSRYSDLCFIFLKFVENVRATPRVLVFLTRIMFMKVSMFLPNPEVCGGRLPLMNWFPFLRSVAILSIMLLRIFLMEMAQSKKWCLVHL